MKQLLTFLILILLVCPLSAQYGSVPFEKLAELEKTKTYVVLTKSDTLYNFYVRDAFERYWTFNDYVFIDYE